jgi:hypothetical protein
VRAELPISIEPAFADRYPFPVVLHCAHVRSAMRESYRSSSFVNDSRHIPTLRLCRSRLPLPIKTSLWPHVLSDVGRPMVMSLSLKHGEFDVPKSREMGR